MNAQKILELIENVDPADSAAMDEIDREAWYYITRPKKEDQIRKGYVFRPAAPKYTRSRDALKAIRPEGWLFTVGILSYDRIISMGHRPNEGYADKYTVASEELPTEELAELHAIISAIEWERQNGK